jgi:DNA polymerase IV
VTTRACADGRWRLAARRERGVVAAASYEARRFGVHSAMPSVTARRKCPELGIPAAALRRLQGCVAADPRHFCPLYAAHPAAFAGDAYLDVTAPLLDRGSVTAIAQEIKLAIRTETDLTAPASVSKFPIKLALDHRKPDGLFVIRAPPGG